MSLVSRCQTAPGRPSALPAGSVVQTLLILIVALGLGLAHIHLRVRLSEVRSDISSLQTDQSRTIAEINKVRTENESLKSQAQLEIFARRELGMVPSDPDDKIEIAMPEEIQTRYALARATGAEPSAAVELAQKERTTPILASLGERIGLVGDAQADEPAR